jgi:hypothetical protein
MTCDLRKSTRCFSHSLEREQALKKRVVTPQGNAQGFRGRLVRLIGLTFERGALIGKGFRQARHDLANELISLPDSPSRIIDKTSLHGIPARAKLFGHIGQKQRGELLLFSLRVGVVVVEHWLPEILLNLLIYRRHLRKACLQLLFSDGVQACAAIGLPEATSGAAVLISSISSKRTR